ncbi:MAG: ABC-2 family transporter protein [Clostridiales bacterium]|nr:ABC-2 family transporter protein [Clostridiales bacterium]
MISGIKAAFIGLKLAFAENMAYRSSFFISMIIMFITEFFFPIVTLVIYNTGASFPGWTLYELLLVQGTFILAKGIAFPLFIGLFFQVMWLVRSGNLDIYLLRPRPLLFSLVITSFNVHDMSKIISGTLIIVYAASHLPSFSLYHWIWFVLLLIFSVALIFSFILLMVVYTMRFIGSDKVLGLIDPITQYGFYPRDIYGWPVKSIITNIIPVAMIGFYPASILMGKDPEGFIPAIVATCVFIVLSIFLWVRSSSKYTSAGG